MSKVRPPSPAVDPDNVGYWSAAREHELRLCACASCGAVVHLPRGMCPSCHSTEMVWKQVSGGGRVHSWTVVRHQVHPAFPTPYTVVLVDVDAAPGVRVVSRIDGEVPLTVGDPLELWFEEIADGVSIPQWRLPHADDTSHRAEHG